LAFPCYIYHSTPIADNNNEISIQHGRFFELLEKNGDTGDLVLGMVGCDLVSSTTSTTVGISDGARSPNDGYMVGGLVGLVGLCDGSNDGLPEVVTVGSVVEGVRDAEGILVGSFDGVIDEGSFVPGDSVGKDVEGVVVGARLGIDDGILVGISVEGANVGDIEGSIEGNLDGVIEID
jgi:hypothetical protein